MAYELDEKIAESKARIEEYSEGIDKYKTRIKDENKKIKELEKIKSRLVELYL